MDAQQKTKTDETFRKLEETAPASWVVGMRLHFAETGAYRAEDLRRLLGDPEKGVEVGTSKGLSHYLQSHR